MIESQMSVPALLPCWIYFFHCFPAGSTFLLCSCPSRPQITTVLQHFQRMNLKGEARFRSQQLVAVAKRWTAPMDSLVSNYMPYACIVVSVLKEVALYAGVQQV